MKNVLWLVGLLCLIAGGFALQDRPNANLPDLVVQDIFYDAPYIKVRYSNEGGSETPRQDDFLVSVRHGEKTFPGNSHYRFKLSRGVQTTGGFTVGLVGLAEGDTADVTAVVDWEDRVQESDERNNSFTKTVTLR